MSLTLIDQVPLGYSYYRYSSTMNQSHHDSQSKSYATVSNKFDGERKALSGSMESKVVSSSNNSCSIYKSQPHSLKLKPRYTEDWNAAIKFEEDNENEEIGKYQKPKQPS